MVYCTCCSADVSPHTRGYQCQAVSPGGVVEDVIAPPPGEFFSEINDPSFAILLSYDTARVLLGGDA